MAENSGIEWTHHTFNPWIGCTKISAACDHCYAEAWDNRFGGQRWGPHADRTRTKTWGSPVKWNRDAEAKGGGNQRRVGVMELAAWIDQARNIDRRRFSAARHRAIARHGNAFPLDLRDEIDRRTLALAKDVLTGWAGWNSFTRPTRGNRDGHWSTPALMAVNNQIARLGPGNYQGDAS